MDKVINTSFIAKQSLAPNSRPGLQPGGMVLMIAWILLFLSLAVFGGTLAYRSLLTQEIKAPCAPTSAGSEVQKCGLVASVGREEKNLDRNTIVLLQRADAKLRLADQLLAQHVDILPVFRLLEEITLPSVSYTKFSYTPNALALEGRALSYEDLAVQVRHLTLYPVTLQVDWGEGGNRGSIPREDTCIDPAPIWHLDSFHDD
jgi:hypothetical protein